MGKKYLTIRPTEGLVFEVIGKYPVVRKTVKQAKKMLKTAKKGLDIGEQEAKAYKKKLMDFIDKNIPHEAEKKHETEIDRIQHITEDIENGKTRKN